MELQLSYPTIIDKWSMMNCKAYFWIVNCNFEKMKQPNILHALNDWVTNKVAE